MESTILCHHVATVAENGQKKSMRTHLFGVMAAGPMTHENAKKTKRWQEFVVSSLLDVLYRFIDILIQMAAVVLRGVWRVRGQRGSAPLTAFHYLIIEGHFTQWKKLIVESNSQKLDTDSLGFVAGPTDQPKVPIFDNSGIRINILVLGHTKLRIGRWEHEERLSPIWYSFSFTFYSASSFLFQ